MLTCFSEEQCSAYSVRCLLLLQLTQVYLQLEDLIQFFKRNAEQGAKYHPCSQFIPLCLSLGYRIRKGWLLQCFDFQKGQDCLYK